MLRGKLREVAMSYQGKAEEIADCSPQEALRGEDLTLMVYLDELGPSQLAAYSEIIDIARKNHLTHAICRGNCIDIED